MARIFLGFQKSGMDLIHLCDSCDSRVNKATCLSIQEKVIGGGCIIIPLSTAAFDFIESDHTVLSCRGWLCS